MTRVPTATGGRRRRRADGSAGGLSTNPGRQVQSPRTIRREESGGEGPRCEVVTARAVRVRSHPTTLGRPAPSARLGPVALAAPALVVSLLAAGCPERQPPPPVELETVDVAPTIDAELSTEDDLRAVRRAPTLSGVLPGGVPADLPLVVPSSVVDFGPADGGRAYLELDTGRTPAEVRSWLGERLPAAGWTIRAIGDGGLEASKGRRRVGYRLTDLAPGTRIRLDYLPE